VNDTGAHGALRLLRFIACGSVDDGKSTLIGRLLWEARAVCDDQAMSLEKASRLHGTRGDRLDFALLLDGLHAELEQGITIDVAYRYFSTARRRFIVADAPGHEQYTRNMATGASTAQAALLLVDARKGLLVQTQRHSRIVRLFGIRHVAVVVNKMDLVGWNEERFAEVRRGYQALQDELGFDCVAFIPVCAVDGDNIFERSARMPWYGGPTLVEYLEGLDVGESADASFRMPVQWVNRPNSEFRGFCGRVAAGTVRAGDRVRVVPSGTESTIGSIVVFEGTLNAAREGQAITLTLDDEIDVSRGDVLCAASDPVEAADQFEAHLIWTSSQPLIAGRSYTAKIHSRYIGATVTLIKHKVDVASGAHLAARSLRLNDLAVVNIATDAPVPFEPYAKSKTMGAVILIDRISQETVGAGMIHFALRRAANAHWQAIDVSPQARAAIKGQAARCFWLTGLPAFGKSTIANLLERRLHADGLHTYLLDGDNVRHGLNRDLGFTEPDRVENIRRVAEVARLMVEAGLIVIVSFISPYRADRAFARSRFQPEQFVEVYVNTPASVCERRDPKGLWAKARSGALVNFTGMDSPYEPPESPDIRVDTTECAAAEAADRLANMAFGAGGSHGSAASRQVQPTDGPR